MWVNGGGDGKQQTVLTGVEEVGLSGLGQRLEIGIRKKEVANPWEVDASETFNWHSRMNGGLSTQLRNTRRRQALGEVGWGCLGHELKTLLKY